MQGNVLVIALVFVLMLVLARVRVHVRVRACVHVYAAHVCAHRHMCKDGRPGNPLGLPGPPHHNAH